MKYAALLFIVAFLAGCGNRLDGTYALLGNDGLVRTQDDGTPHTTLTLDDGRVILRSGSDSEFGTYEVIDSTVVVALPDMQHGFEIEGDRLISGTGPRADILVKM